MRNVHLEIYPYDTNIVLGHLDQQVTNSFASVASGKFERYASVASGKFKRYAPKTSETDYRN